MVSEARERNIRPVKRMRILPPKLLDSRTTPSGTAGSTRRFDQGANLPQKEMVRRFAGAVGTKLPINQKSHEQNGARSHGSDQPVHMYCCADSHGTPRSSVHCFADTPSVLQRLFMGRTKGLKGDGAGMDIRVFPPKARDSRFERSMGDALRQQNEKLEMQEVFDSSCIIDDTSGSEV